MGTRGVFGFYYKGKYYVVYNHYDSYPEGLGKDLIDELKHAIALDQLCVWKVLLSQINVVSDATPPTQEDIEILVSYTDLKVGTRSVNDWYCLLHKCQGSFIKTLHSGYIYNHVDDKNGLPEWEEYGYIVDFDNKKLLFHDHDKIYEYPLDALPKWN